MYKVKIISVSVLNTSEIIITLHFALNKGEREHIETPG